jgi:hypothetical protein
LNPRSSFPDTRFRGELFQPLRHLSGERGSKSLTKAGRAHNTRRAQVSNGGFARSQRERMKRSSRRPERLPIWSNCKGPEGTAVCSHSLAGRGRRLDRITAQTKSSKPGGRAESAQNCSAPGKCRTSSGDSTGFAGASIDAFARVCKLPDQNVLGPHYRCAK